MLIGGEDISDEVITLGRCRVDVCLHSHSFPLSSDWRKYKSTEDGEPEGNWRLKSNRRGVVASSPSFSGPAARAPLRAFSQAYPLNKQTKI